MREAAKTAQVELPWASVPVQIQSVDGAQDLPLPFYATQGSAGADLHAAVDEPIVVSMGEIRLIPTGIKIALPEGFEAQVRARSGLALRKGLTLVNAPGTIDSDYRGEIKVIVSCLKREPCTIRRGDRIAQLIIAPVARARFMPVGELSATIRGAGGFGHTGFTPMASQ